MKSGSEKKPPIYDVPALRKAVGVLELLAASEEPLGVSEISRQVEIPKNMAFRLLVTLDDLGWIRQADSKPRYQLTLAPFRLFARPITRHGLTAACHAPLRWLHKNCREMVYVGILHNRQALNIQVIDGVKPIRVAAEVGSTFDLHCTAHGKVLLAHAPEGFRKDTLSGALRRYTAQTVTDPEVLEKELQQIRERGYGLNNEEYGRGLIGIAAPVFDEEGGIQAAMGVFTATMNLSMEEMEREVGPLVMKAAEWASLNSTARE